MDNELITLWKQEEEIAHITFKDESFDMIINHHGDFDVHMNLKEQKELFEAAGFAMLQAQEAYRPILLFGLHILLNENFLDLVWIVI